MQSAGSWWPRFRARRALVDGGSIGGFAHLTALAVCGMAFHAQVGFPATAEGGERTFTEDAAFLQQHTSSFVLQADGGKIVVAPEYQGRVMTSTPGGPRDLSLGWINYPVIERGRLPLAEAQGRMEAHIYVFGGEERFWLGPEGGQFAIFFKPGVEFDFEHWHTPAVIDTEPFTLEARTQRTATLSRDFEIENYSRTRFRARVRRIIRMLSREQIASALGLDLPEGVGVVGYETDNRLTNTGSQAWTRTSGALSIWLLGMYKPSSQAVIVIPFRPGAADALGPVVHDAYFGKVPPDRLIVGDGVLFLRADGQYRSKIGVPPKRSKAIAGSYDRARNVLTILTYPPPAENAHYVNSAWAWQARPFAGDVINAYNDGAPAPGAAPLGPFYELETSSPAAFLAPGASIRHVQRTLHFQGDPVRLSRISLAVLGVSLERVARLFK